MTRAMTRMGLVLAALMSFVLPAAAQDIVVTQGNVEVFDNGTFDFGELRPGGLTSKTFTIRNESPFRIDLGGTVTGAGWVGAINKTTLRAGQKARLVITVDRATSGQKSAQVSITDSNIGGEIFAFRVIATVEQSAPEIRLTNGRSVVEDNGFVSFGRIAESGSTRRVFTLRNIGTSDLNLSNFSLTGAGFELIRSPSNSLRPGKTTRFAIQMDGGNPGSRAGVVSFGTNIQGDPEFRFELGGTVGAALPDLQISQSGVLIEDGDSIQYEETVTGAALPKRFRIRNNGDGALSIMSLTSSDPQFVVDGLTTMTIPGGLAADFFLVFRPSVEGTSTGTFTIQTNDPMNPSLAVNVSGVGGPPPEIRFFIEDVEAQSGDTALFQTNTGVTEVVEYQCEIQNIGDGDLSVNLVAIDDIGGVGDPNFRLRFPVPPFVLPTGGSEIFVVQFGPPSNLVESVNYGAELAIINSDPDESAFQINIVVTVNSPPPEMRSAGRSASSFFVVDSDGAQVGPGDSFDFGTTAGDHAIVRSFTVHNTTGATLRGGKVNVSGVGFSVLSQPRSTLAHGESTTFDIAFDTRRVGRFAAAVTLDYRGAEAGEPFVFAVSGESAR